MGEKITIKYADGTSDDCTLYVYAGTKIKKELNDKNIEVGEITKASNGKYYLKGKGGSFIRLKDIDGSKFG